MEITIPADFEEASAEQRVAYVQALWDKIASDPANLAIPEHHKRLLEARLEEHKKNPQAGKPWNEVRDQLLSKLRSR